MRRPAWSHDPLAWSLALFALLAVGGFAGIAIGWMVAARTLVVPFQTPALVSGAMGGAALVVIGVALGGIQVGRRDAAAERAESEAVLDEVAGLVEAWRRERR